MQSFCCVYTLYVCCCISLDSLVIGACPGDSLASDHEVPPWKLWLQRQHLGTNTWTTSRMRQRCSLIFQRHSTPSHIPFSCRLCLTSVFVVVYLLINGLKVFDRKTTVRWSIVRSDKSCSTGVHTRTSILCGLYWPVMLTWSIGLYHHSALCRQFSAV